MTASTERSLGPWGHRTSRTALFALAGLAMFLPACNSSGQGGPTTLAPLPSPSPSAAPSAPPSAAPGAVTVGLGETSPNEMYIHLSSATAAEGPVTFAVTNEGSRTHEFVVLRTDTPAGDLPIVSFEGEKDRIDEEGPGVTNVGETGDMKAGTTATLNIDLAPGHYAVVCNLPGHYRMGMHQDFTVT